MNAHKVKRKKSNADMGVRNVATLVRTSTEVLLQKTCTEKTQRSEMIQ